MNIPGSNLLNMARRIISSQNVIYYQFLGRTLNTIGQDMSTYAAPRIVSGSWQPVPRNLYTQYGLDLQKDYFTFYASVNALDVGRDVSGDQLSFNNQRYQVESANDWYAVDGWVGIICCHIGVDIQSTTLIGFGPNNTFQNFNNGNTIGQ